MRRTWPDLPGVAVWPWPADAALRVRIAQAPEEEVDEGAVERRWAQMCHHNPRLFDAPILSVVNLAPGHEILCERSSYKLLAVQDQVPTGVEQLSVTGVIVGVDDRGGKHVLIGRRGHNTRIYGGMWELAPSGGLDAPEGCGSLGEHDALAQLQRELQEETGSSARLEGARVSGVCYDAVAHSYDIVLACEMPLAALGVADGADAESWEYGGVRWLPLAGVPAFDREHASAVIAPTRGLFRFLGWAPEP